MCVEWGRGEVNTYIAITGDKIDRDLQLVLVKLTCDSAIIVAMFSNMFWSELSWPTKL